MILIGEIQDDAITQLKEGPVFYAKDKIRIWRHPRYASFFQPMPIAPMRRFSLYHERDR